MDSCGELFKKGEPAHPSRMFEAYQKLVKENFKNLEGFTDNELDWLQVIHDKHLSFFKEERRMHFGAFALAALATVIMLPNVLSETPYFLPLAAAFCLLIALLIPYTFVYMRYEEGVRKKMRESMLIENERSLRKDRQNSTKTAVLDGVS